MLIFIAIAFIILLFLFSYFINQMSEIHQKINEIEKKISNKSTSDRDIDIHHTALDDGWFCENSGIKL